MSHHSEAALASAAMEIQCLRLHTDQDMIPGHDAYACILGVLGVCRLSSSQLVDIWLTLPSCSAVSPRFTEEGRAVCMAPSSR